MNLYHEICKLYDYNIKAKIISYKKYFEDSNPFRELLFIFCFLTKEGSVVFRDINDLWFFETAINSNEIKLYLGIIEYFINKINNNHYDKKQKCVSLVKDFLDISNYNKFITFKYLQSIFTYKKDNTEYIFLSLFYTLLFEFPIIKENLKIEFKSVINKRLETLHFEDKICYNKINNEFLKYFNKLLNPNEKKVKEIYDYLCNFEENEKYNIEIFNYFSSIKELILNYEKKINEKINNNPMQNPYNIINKLERIKLQYSKINYNSVNKKKPEDEIPKTMNYYSKTAILYSLYHEID